VIAQSFLRCGHLFTITVTPAGIEEAAPEKYWEDLMPDFELGAKVRLPSLQSAT
jgi:hypothetical protein